MASEKKGNGSAEKEDDILTGPPIQTTQLGVYRVVTEIRPPFDPREKWKKATGGFPTLWRLTKDVYALGPWMVFLFLFLEFWSSCVDCILSLHLSSRILTIIEAGLKTGHPDGAAIFQAVALRMLSLAFTAVVDWSSARLGPILQGRLETRFQNRILRSKLATDLTGVQANLSTEHVTEQTSWRTFKSLLDTATKLAGAVAQLGYVFRLVQSTGHAPVFTLLCLTQPVLLTFFRRSLWLKPHVVEATDPHFLRMKGLRELSEPKYKQDIITGDIVHHILQEFRRTVGLLGDTDISSANEQYQRLVGAPSHVATKLASELPLLYYAATSIMSPAALSLSTIATLHQSESLLTWMFQYLMYSTQNVERLTTSVRAVYDLENVVHETKGGDISYPPVGSPHERGMPFELRNVSFSYPGATAKALDNVTLTIKPGQLVVVVGSNGSGKSTIIKLLTRLYDATDGEILVDGEDIKNYKLADMRHATAALTQDHHLYPLSLSENIGLGNPAHVADMDMIREAARQGGAEDVIAKLADGFGTVLEHPRNMQYGSDVFKGDDSLLAVELEKMTKEADVSGGERQRLVASRTFMRFTSGAVKLVCVDEPSSNLDPQAEWQLFKNLRTVRAGKTMIFVTHRFGHLTKHADVILCVTSFALGCADPSLPGV
ncbi:P-loop containing nucleoside triphosphate hydrolase protein [Mycena maculata]|uniref:P-loop containing nucleoside triphosphate hydrolase protein n=1 Tax=Mycena maculata TaxID=230809 RepID=A0AAD7K5Y1_9AGAR|nr:P-loop containing nucleoside triphosphate hydrolase protein [Mycena maculata]